MGTSSTKDSNAATEDTPLKEKVKAEVKEAVKDVEEEGYQAYLGGFTPCVKLAPVSFAFLQNNRKMALYIAHFVCLFCVILSVVSFWGAFSHTTTLASIPWAALDGPTGKANAGVKWVCWDLPDPPPKGTFWGDGTDFVVKTKHGGFWECQTWYDFDCTQSPSGADACESCKHQTKTIAFSVFMAVSSFWGFYSQTGQREHGEDSNYVKFMACFSCLVGGTNFLVSILTYWYTCIYSAQKLGLDVSPGLGLKCMLIAAFLKVVMGVVHLGLPVENTSKKADV